MDHSPALDAPLRTTEQVRQARERLWKGRTVWRRDPVTRQEMAYYVDSILPDGRAHLICGETGDQQFDYLRM